MDFAPSKRILRRDRKAARNTAGRMRGTVIAPPSGGHENYSNSMDDIYADDSSSRRASPQNILDEGGGSDNSGGSRFSQGSLEQAYFHDQRHVKEKYPTDKKTRRKRQAVKDALAESQRQAEEDKPAAARREEECVVLDEDRDGEGAVGRILNPGRSFDGVRIDKVLGKKQQAIIDGVVQQVGRNAGGEFDGQAPSGRGGGKKRNMRGRKHRKPAMAKSLSPQNNEILPTWRHGANEIRSRSEYGVGGGGNAFSTHYSLDDPLDEARLRQEADRRTSAPASRGGGGRRTVVENLTESPERAETERREKKRKGRKGGDMTQRMGDALMGTSNIFGTGNGAGLKSSRERQRETERHKQQMAREEAEKRKRQREREWQRAVERREDRAGAAIMRQTSCDARSSSERSGPSSGEKRKLEETSSVQMNYFSHEGSRGNAIDVDAQGDRADEDDLARAGDGTDDDGMVDLSDKELEEVGGDGPVDTEEDRRSADFQADDFAGADGVDCADAGGGYPAGERSQERDDALDHSILSVATLPADGGDDPVQAALRGCDEHLGQEDIKHLKTPRPAPREAQTTLNLALGGSDFGIRRVPATRDRNSSTKKKSIEPHVFANALRGPKQDDIVSTPEAKDSLRGSFRRTYSRIDPPIPRKAGLSRDHGSRKTNRTFLKLKMQGGVIEDTRGSECMDGGWLDRMGTGSERCKAEKAKAKAKDRRRSKGSSSTMRSYDKRRTRSNSRSSERKQNEIITIDSSSDEEDDTSATESPEVPSHRSLAEGRGKRRRAVGDKMPSIDAVRMAIGKKVVKSNCALSIQFGTKDPYIMFSFWDNGEKSEHCVYLKRDDIQEVKYFIAGDEDGDSDDRMTVMAFRITPSEKNNFNKYTSYYDQGEGDELEDAAKRYISLEVRDPEYFKAMLEQMRENEYMKMWCCPESEIRAIDLDKYAPALLEDNRRERADRLSIAGRTRSGGRGKKKNADNKLLLVYPFELDEVSLAKASSGLKELGGDLLGVEGANPPLGMERPGPADEGDGNDGGGKSSRTHYVTIRLDDKDRLSPGEFLNDTLVDFWMRWISRGEPRQPESKVHFFTSHFMTTLKNDGVDAVVSWTAKKNINVFEKKFIFVPVNADLHWSLCVVVNPGLIGNYYDDIDNVPISEEHSSILFFDSLKMHSKNTYAKSIRTWLNREWKRLEMGDVQGCRAPFNHESMPLRSPKIPYQENGCDCGVFVCRYAYNLYVMRHQGFTWEDLGHRRLMSKITKGPAFQFDMSDIARIREEIGVLIENLSKHYLRAKRQEKADRKARRREIENSQGGEENGSLENVSEGAIDAPLEKEDMSSKTIAAPPDNDGGSTEGCMTDAAVNKDKDGDVVMASSEEKGSYEEPAAFSDGNEIQERMGEDIGERGRIIDALMSPSEEKENISQQEAVFQNGTFDERNAPEKPVVNFQDSSETITSDII